MGLGGHPHKQLVGREANLDGRGCTAAHEATQALQEGSILPRQPLPVGGLSSALHGRARLHALQPFLDMH